ncbi:hypothetical protein [Macrococcoides canis]|uniref:hypothetical protein n=1 Tax=Macrococcoides canis TaxID=1855823 RepID=UPI00105CE390|nr:hypothetical protein [Macrococcus canis]TDM23471.1 hypothetical protein ETI02_03460 [Macrococcus canis]
MFENIKKIKGYDELRDKFNSLVNEKNKVESLRTKITELDKEIAKNEEYITLLRKNGKYEEARELRELVKSKEEHIGKLTSEKHNTHLMERVEEIPSLIDMSQNLAKPIDKEYIRLFNQFEKDINNLLITYKALLEKKVEYAPLHFAWSALDSYNRNGQFSSGNIRNVEDFNPFSYKQTDVYAAQQLKNKMDEIRNEINKKYL